MIPDLTALREAAEEAGHALGIAAGFRSYGTQASLYRRRVESLDRDEATGKTARPGHSEHQLGTTLDFKSAGESDVTKSWGNTPEGTWMADNAWRFGFQLVYPRNRTAETCFWFEPWHFRYFGRERAAEIHTSVEDCTSSKAWLLAAPMERRLPLPGKSFAICATNGVSVSALTETLLLLSETRPLNV